MSRLEQWEALKDAMDYGGNRDILVHLYLESDTEKTVETYRALYIRQRLIAEELLNDLCIESSAGKLWWVLSESIVSLNKNPNKSFSLVFRPPRRLR